MFKHNNPDLVDIAREATFLTDEYFLPSDVWEVGMVHPKFFLAYNGHRTVVARKIDGRLEVIEVGFSNSSPFFDSSDEDMEDEPESMPPPEEN